MGVHNDMHAARRLLIHIRIDEAQEINLLLYMATLILTIPNLDLTVIAFVQSIISSPILRRVILVPSWS